MYYEVPVYYMIYTALMLIPSLIIALVYIPRFFIYSYVKDEKEEYFRRRGYYIVRVLTTIALVCLQAALVVSVGVAIGKFLDQYGDL